MNPEFIELHHSISSVLMVMRRHVVTSIERVGILFVCMNAREHTHTNVIESSTLWFWTKSYLHCSWKINQYIYRSRSQRPAVRMCTYFWMFCTQFFYTEYRVWVWIAMPAATVKRKNDSVPLWKFSLAQYKAIRIRFSSNWRHLTWAKNWIKMQLFVQRVDIV